MSNTVPEGWSSKYISDVVSLQYGKSPKDVLDPQGAYPVIGTGGITGHASAFLHEGQTTVIGRKGTINSPSFLTDKFWAIDTTYFVSDYRKTDPKWFYYCLSANDLEKYNEASGVPSLNRDTLYTIPLLHPPLPEQKKIAAILTSVDEVIEKTQAQIDKLRALKTGMMQELLTKGIGPDGRPHTEFKDSPIGRIPAGWEIKTIESVLTKIIDYRGKSPPKSESGVPLITAKNIRNGYIDPNPREYIFNEQYENWMVRGIPETGDVFITTEAPLGNVARVPNYKFAIGQRVLALCPIKETISTDFLLYVMQGQAFKEQLDLQSTGSTVAGIKQSTFRQILVPVPSLAEQRKISKYLDGLNELIDSKNNILRQNEKLKKALMQDLLTGKVRVTVDS